MAPTSALVAVSEGMTVSLLKPLVSIHDNSRRGEQLGIGNVLRDRGLRCPADDWGLTSVVCGRSTSWMENAVLAPHRVAEATQGNSEGSSDSYEETFFLGIPCHSAVNDCRD